MVDLLPHERQVTGSPDTTFRPQVSPGTFGAQVGAATEQFGASVAAVGHHWGDIVANDAVNQYQTEVGKLVNGDPEKQTVGPDGKIEADLGYLGTRGRAALDQRPQVAKKLDEITKRYMGGLYSADQKELFDTASRRYRAIVDGTMGRHADQQGVVYATGTADAQAKIAAASIASNADNAELVAHGASDLIDAHVKKAMILGAQPGDPQWTAARDQGKREAIATQASAIAVNDPQRAMRIIESNKDSLGVIYDDLANKFRARAEQAQGRDVADGLLTGSSPNENNIGNVRPRGSNTGFVQVKSFEEGVNLAVQNVRAYPQAFNGGKDMTLQQIGARWAPKGDGANDPNQWAKNVAAGGGLPVDRPIDLNDPEVAAKFARGVHVAEWGGKKARPVEDYKTALTGAKGTPSQETPRSQSDLIEEILAKNLPPQAEAAAIARINKSYALQSAVEAKRKAEFKQKVDDSVTEALVTGTTTNPVPESDFIRHFGPADGVAKFADYQSNIVYSADRQAVEGMSDGEQMKYLNNRMPKPGAPGYAYAIDRHNKLTKDVAAIQKDRREDPAGVVEKNPAVAAARQQYDEKNPASFKAVADARLQAQEQLGIEPEYRSPITKGEALKLMNPVQMALPGMKAEELEKVGAKYRDMFGENATKAFIYSLRAMHVGGQAAADAEGVLKDLMSGKPLTSTERRQAKDAQANAEMEKVVSDIQSKAPPLTATEMWMNLPDSMPAPVNVPNPGTRPVPTNEALRDLRDNKMTAKDFNDIYGPGTADKLMKEYPFFFSRGR